MPGIPQDLDFCKKLFLMTVITKMQLCKYICIWLISVSFSFFSRTSTRHTNVRDNHVTRSSEKCFKKEKRREEKRRRENEETEKRDRSSFLVLLFNLDIMNRRRLSC